MLLIFSISHFKVYKWILLKIQVMTAIIIGLNAMSFILIKLHKPKCSKYYLITKETFGLTTMHSFNNIPYLLICQMFFNLSRKAQHLFWFYDGKHLVNKWSKIFWLEKKCICNLERRLFLWLCIICFVIKMPLFEWEPQLAMVLRIIGISLIDWNQQ